jgi:hypothetical protein
MNGLLVVSEFGHVWSFNCVSQSFEERLKQQAAGLPRLLLG